MTSTHILEHLAKEFSIPTDRVRAVLEMLDAGLSAPFVGRFRRAETGELAESVVRRLGHLRDDLAELDRRRATILRLLENVETVDDADRERIRRCMDRFDLEDLFVPHRRPEPEVQLALDRGLGPLADRLTRSIPREEREASSPATPTDPAAEAPPAAAEAAPPSEPAASDAPATEAASPSEAAASSTEAASPSGAASPAAPGEPAPAATPDEGAESDEVAPGTASAPVATAEHRADTPGAQATGGEPAAPVATTDAPKTEAKDGDAPATGSAAAETEATEATEAKDADQAGANGTQAASPEGGEDAHSNGAERPVSPGAEGAQSTGAEGAQSTGAEGAQSTGAEGVDSTGAEGAGAKPGKRARKSAARASADEGGASITGRVTLTPELARVCAEFVSPDRGIHTEMEALTGATRILSDRLGRNAKLRGTIRRLMRKSGVLTVRPTVDESKLGRHKSLLRIKSPVRQVQGRQLLGIRQAQKERVVTTNVVLSREKALPRVRAALGKHTRPEFEGVLDEVARQALEYRLIPTVEADVRLELKERGDEEALRFLSQHLRQILLTSAAGRRPVVGLDVNAKGDWTLAALDADGGLRGPYLLVETGEKGTEDLGKELAQHLRDDPATAIGIGHGKGARTALPRLRQALRAGGLDLPAHIVNEGGLSSYANSELARKELPEATVPQRMAASIGRRLQDPMAEILKVDARQLGLGSEQGLVTKAALKRMLSETIESCVAHVGCDVNRAEFPVLRHVPGVSDATARKILEMRAQRPFASREELRAEGLLTEAEWTSAIAFLRIHHGVSRLDSTGLHPHQYDLVARIVESTGGSVEDSLGRPGITQGLRRVDFDVDEYTWRDLMREIAYPGRDPRPRAWTPELLDPDADPVTLTKDRVIEGIVSNVASFGAFVDVGLPNDAMIHISEISDRYVRDARELLHVGQVVRVRILENNSQRLSVSLKRVPRREPGPGRGRGRGPREGRGAASPNLRAAQTRRDGLAGGREGRGGGRGRGGPGRGGPGGGRGGGPGGGGGGGGGGRGRGGPGRGRGRDRFRDDDRVSADELERAGAAGNKGFTPFAKFFGKEDSKDADAPRPESGSDDSPSSS